MTTEDDLSQSLPRERGDKEEESKGRAFSKVTSEEFVYLLSQFSYVSDIRGRRNSLMTDRDKDTAKTNKTTTAGQK